MIKSILLSFICLFMSMQAYSQAPDAFQFQALVRNTSGELLVNTKVSVTFKIHQDMPVGTVVFSETHANISTSAAGIACLQIGKGTATVNSLSKVNWSDGPYFLETLIDYGNGSVNLGTQQLLSVPFAQYAKNADNVKLKSPNGKSWSVSVDDSGVISTKELTE